MTTTLRACIILVGNLPWHVVGIVNTQIQVVVWLKGIKGHPHRIEDGPAHAGDV